MTRCDLEESVRAADRTFVKGLAIPQELCCTELYLATEGHLLSKSANRSESGGLIAGYPTPRDGNEPTTHFPASGESI